MSEFPSISDAGPNFAASFFKLSSHEGESIYARTSGNIRFEETDNFIRAIAKNDSLIEKTIAEFVRLSVTTKEESGGHGTVV